MSSSLCHSDDVLCRSNYGFTVKWIKNMLISNNSTRIHCWHYPHHWQHHSHQTQPAESLSKTPGRAIYTVIHSPSTISFQLEHPTHTDTRDYWPWTCCGWIQTWRPAGWVCGTTLAAQRSSAGTATGAGKQHTRKETFHCFVKPWIEIFTLHWTLHFALGADLVWPAGGYQRYQGTVCASAGVQSLLDFKSF